MLLSVFLACVRPVDSTIPEVSEGDSAPDEDSGVPTIEHCRPITTDATWGPAHLHRVSCALVVESGTLTILGGTTVEFDEGASLAVGTEDHAASLVVAGETAGVSFVPSAKKPWGGIVVGEAASAVSLAGLVVKDTTAGVKVSGSEITIGSLSVDGVSEGCGLTLDGGARLADGSAGLTVTNASDWAVCGEVATAHTIPAQASSYTGNALDGAYLTGSLVEAAVTWENIGVPYVIAETVAFEGTAEAPAVLTLTEGVTVLVERDRGLRFSYSGGASQLLALGSEASPIRIAGFGADTAGYWRGITVGRGADELWLEHATLSGAGGDGAALLVEDTQLNADNLTVELSAGGGIELVGSAEFGSASSNLTITASEVPLVLTAASVPSLPTIGLNVFDNGTDAILVAGESEVAESGSWPDPGVPFWVATDIEVNGTESAPAVVTLLAGVTLLFENDTGIHIGRTGAAGFEVLGSDASPVTMLPWATNTAGAWSGIGVYENALSTLVNLNNVEVGYAGGSVLRGNIHIDDAAATLTNVRLHDSLEWGLYLSGTATTTLAGVSYENNGEGTCNACE